MKSRLDQLVVPDSTIRTERRYEEGEPVAEILLTAKECGADLIVMGTHGRTGLARLLMGSVADQVVRRAECPVVTVKVPFVKEEATNHAVAVPASVAEPTFA
jgi:nucleotide-binding universal stress UspA family protein